MAKLVSHMSGYIETLQLVQNTCPFFARSVLDFTYFESSKIFKNRPNHKMLSLPSEIKRYALSYGLLTSFYHPYLTI